jgi:hypothetical protein
MSACREGVDLFNHNGRFVFFRDLRRGRFNRLMWRDTFGRVLCWLSGEHVLNQHQDGPGEPLETSCYVCCKWLHQEKGEWKIGSIPTSSKEEAKKGEAV